MAPHNLKYLFLIVVIFTSACIETDIYLPSLPDMMAFFEVTEDLIQNLLIWNFIGICLSGPFYGPLSDAFGRKNPLLFSLGLFLVGSIVTLFATDFNVMLIGRLLQGLGSGGCFSLGTAILFDVYQQDKALRALNQLNMILPILMALAPLLGGYLNSHFGFRSNFMAIALLVFLSLFICQFFYKETLAKEKRALFSWKNMQADFRRCISCQKFWLIAIVLSLIFGGYISFLSITSILFILDFGMQKEVFPLVQSSILGGWVIASLLMNSALAKFRSERVKLIGIILSIGCSLGLGLTAYFAPTSIYWITGIMTLFAFGANWLSSMYFTEGMELFPEVRGMTSSLLTSTRLLLSTLVVKCVSSLYDGTIYPVAWTIIGIEIIILPLIYLNERKVKVATLDE